MRRSLTTAFLLILVVAAAAPAFAKRCEAEMPETLLSLYRNSEHILVARFDRELEGGVIRDEEAYTVVARNKYFNVSSALKGENRKFIEIREEEYRYKDVVPSDGEEAYDYQVLESDVQLEPGDLVILFVRFDKDQERLALANASDGIRKLTAEQMPAYENRIRELNSIFAAEKVSDKAIVEWLVRTAEDPATRWEGSFELLQSFDRAEWQAAAAKERREAIARGEVTAAAAEFEETGPDTAIYARLLTEDQKLRLSNILLAADAAAGYQETPVQRTLVRGDRELIELVKRWGDPRMAGFLVGQLKQSISDPYEMSMAMDSAVKLLNDPRLSAIADRFRDIYYEDGEKVVPSATPVNVNVGQNGEISATSEVLIVRGEIDGEKHVMQPKITYKDLRRRLHSEFVGLADKLLAKTHENSLR